MKKSNKLRAEEYERKVCYHEIMDEDFYWHIGSFHNRF